MIPIEQGFVSPSDQRIRQAGSRLGLRIPRAFQAMLWLQLRLLVQNRSGCIVLMMIVLAGLMLSGPPRVEPQTICYVLYWQENPWVQQLRSSCAAVTGMKIEVAPVSDFTDEQGMIVYPMGAHSIQLRPPEIDGAPWRVWYWYNGDDPSAMQPAIEWFWRSTREHFPEQLPFEVLASTLQPSNPITDQLQAKRSLSLREARATWLLISLFFCACYFPVLFLAEQTGSRVLDTLLTKPIGRIGWGGSIASFHGLLALAATTPVLLAFGWTTFAVWSTIVLAFASYMGLAFTIGCATRSTTLASSALILYGVVGGIAVGIAVWLGISPAAYSLEARLMRIFSSEDPPWHLVGGVALWAAWWSAVGTLTFRRVLIR